MALISWPLFALSLIAYFLRVFPSPSKRSMKCLKEHFIQYLGKLLHREMSYCFMGVKVGMTSIGYENNSKVSYVSG